MITGAYSRCSKLIIVHLPKSRAEKGGGVNIHSCIDILNIGCDWLNVFNGAEVEKVGGAMSLMVELFGIGQLEFIVHRSRVTYT